MLDIYCHSCGGFICDPRHIEFRLPAGTAEVAKPRSSFCCCRPPVLFRASPAYSSSPVVPVVPVIPVIAVMPSPAHLSA